MALSRDTIIKGVKILFALVAIGTLPFAVSTALVSYVSTTFLQDATNKTLIEIFINGLSVFVNFFLTAALIFIYYTQSSTQKQQKRIQETEAEVLQSQEKLMRANHTPVIEGPHELAFGYHPDKESDSESDDEANYNDWIYFEISNLGNGISQNFRLVANLIVHEGGSYKGAAFPLSLSRLDRNFIYKYSRNVLRAGEEEVPFGAEVELKYYKEDEDGRIIEGHTHPFSEVIQELHDDGVEHIQVIWKLTYEDILEQEDEFQIYEHRADIEENMTLSEFIQAEYPRIRYVNESISGQDYGRITRLRRWIQRKLGCE